MLNYLIILILISIEKIINGVKESGEMSIYNKGNNFGRTSEVYECEDCSKCLLKAKCHKGNGNRKININDELTGFHKEVIDNLESTHGALLRINRSIQAEGTFGIIKQDRWYKRIVRKVEFKVKLEIYLVSIVHNIYKHHKKKKELMI